MLPGEQSQQVEGLQSKAEIKITHNYWVGLSVECLETEQSTWLPANPLSYARVPASVLPKRPLAWDSIGVGREGVSAEQRRRGLSFRYMKANINPISFTE